MQAHMMHETPIGDNVAPNPVPIETDPAAVARSSFWVHLVWAGTVLLVVAALVNLVLHRLVIRPLSDLEHGMVRMIRGDWHPQTGPRGAEEIDRVRTAFRDMGPLLEAVVRQALQAERLATLAAVSKHLEAGTSTPIGTLAQTAATLTASSEPAIKAAGMEIARSTAGIVALVRSIDSAFNRIGRSQETRQAILRRSTRPPASREPIHAAEGTGPDQLPVAGATERSL
jgi:HAMP domain-containing protein